MSRIASTGRVASAARPFFCRRLRALPDTAPPALASRVADGAALRDGSAVPLLHHLVHPPFSRRLHAPHHLLHHRSRIERYTAADVRVRALVALERSAVVMMHKFDRPLSAAVVIPGEPLRGRAFRSNLRFAPISTAIPFASARSCSLRAPLARVAPTPCRSSGHRARHSPLHARAVTSHRARRGLRLARPGRLRRVPASASPAAPESAPVWAPPPAPPAACFARLPAARSASPPASSAAAAPARIARRTRYLLASPRLRAIIAAEPVHSHTRHTWGVLNGHRALDCLRLPITAPACHAL